MVEVDTDGDRTFTTTLVAAQYALEPYAGPPFDALRAWATPAGGDAAPDVVVFEPGQLVRVTGQYGSTDERGRCPAPVAQANLLLGARWFKRKEVPFNVLQSGELDAFQVVPRQDADVPCAPLPPLPSGVSRRRPDGLPAGGGRGPVRGRLGDGLMTAVGWLHHGAGPATHPAVAPGDRHPPAPSTRGMLRSPGV